MKADPAAITIAPLVIEEYDQIMTLWRNCSGVGLSTADSRESIERFLLRNPGLSFVARSGATIVGTILAGHDGRRGYLYHLAVDDLYRRRGIASKLVEQSLTALTHNSIEKCHIMVFADNSEGGAFWRSISWSRRDDIVLYSKNLCDQQ